MYYKEVCYKYTTTRNYETTTRIRGYEAHTDFIDLFADGRLIIKRNYGYDGASGCTVDDKYNMVPALDHDAKYQLMRLGLIPFSCKTIADEELKEGIKKRYEKCNFLVRNFGNFRAWYYFEGVDHFAAYAAKYGTEPKEMYVE